MIVRLAPWWVACYLAAMEKGMWELADWLAKNPSVEIEWEEAGGD